MKKTLGNISGNKLIASCVFLSLIATRPAAQAAALQEARVSHVIQDVRLLQSNAAPRPAAVNDSVRQGTAVRTGADSRAELTFSDLTITRIGQNTVFSFTGDSREVKLDSGAILLSVPQGAEAAKVRTAAVTASITGGTGLMNSNTGYPTKLYMMEGTGELCDNKGECVTAHGGEMVMDDNGQLHKAVKFNAKLVYQTSLLLTDFPPLPNDSLILAVLNEGGDTGDKGQPEKDLIDIISQKDAASTPGPTQSGGGGKFGALTTITSPDPYVISSGTEINTDPMITTNGVTDQGKIYRGDALDGSQFNYLFGSTSAFDTLIGDFFNTHGMGVPVAVFKFSDLELTGAPTITIPSGATTFLGLVSVGNVTTGGPGGTFTGVDRLFIATVNGSITFGPEIAFSGIGHVNMYARGTGSNLTMGSAISGATNVNFIAEGTVQVNGDVTASGVFNSFSGGDFLAGTGTINAATVDIESLANVNIDGSQFPAFAGDATAIAGASLNLLLNPGGGDTSHFTGTSFTGQGNTINITSSGATPSTFDLETADVSFTAGSGGIQASTIIFANGNSLLLQTTNGGDINIYGRQSPPNGNGGNEGVGTIDASGAVNATSDITNVDDLSAGTSIDVGGELGANTVTAGTTIHVKGSLFADTVTAGGDIDVDGLQVITINAPTGVLTVGSNGIGPVKRDGPSLQHTFNVDSIISPNGIDFNGDNFDEVPGSNPGGRLTINANTIVFVNTSLNSPGGFSGIGFANFDGADEGAFGANNPASGGDGGIFIVNATGNITAFNGADISATTGLNGTVDLQKVIFSGAGGSVTLHSTGGTVSVDDTIEVSSDDSKNLRQSASGGTILLQSDLTTGLGVSVGGNAQLVSYLDDFAPGPGGSITLSTMGSNITVAPGALIEADHGTITMDQTDPPGSTSLISIEGATLTSQVLHITGVGDVNIGTTDHVTINAVSVSLSATNTLNIGDVTVDSQNGDASGDVTFSAGAIGGPGGLEIDRTAGSNVSITTTHDLTLANNLAITVDNSGTSLNAGINTPVPSTSNITLNIGGALTINNDGGLTLHILNNDGGHIANGGNISVTTGGDLTVGSIDSFINNRNGGSIGTGGNMTFNVGGALTTTDSASFVTTNRNDGSGGGTMGSNVDLNLTAASVSVGGFFVADVSTNTGGHIAGNSTITANIAGDMVVQADGSFEIENGGFNVGDVFLHGGTIDGNAQLNVTAGSITVNDNKFGFTALIANAGGGTIHGNAGIDFNVTGDITAQPDAFFDIDNGINGLGNPAGTIDGNATIHVAADNISVNLTDVGLESSIINSGGGMIGGNAAITFDLSGSISTQSDTFFAIYNNSDGKTPPGNITGDATIDVTAANVSANNFEMHVFNDSGGTIGGKATLTLDVSGDFTPNVAQFTIDNSSGGMIGSDAMIKVMGAPNISTNGALEFRIDNRGGTIGGSAVIDVVANSIIVGEDLNAYIDNTGGSIGSISRPSSGGAGTVTIESFGGITVSGLLNVNGTVLADDTVDVGTLAVTNLDTQGNDLVVHSGGITRFAVFGQTPPDLLHTITARFVTSDGGINFDGVAANGDSSVATNGGQLTINANTLTFGQGAAIIPLIQGPVSFNGGDGSSTFGPGNGGTFTVNATNNITVASDIEATSGSIQPFATNPSGNGGTVNLNSTNGTVEVDNRIQVSSAEPTSTVAPFRQSAQGGNIGITSGKTSGSAINISSTGQLLAMLDAAAPGPGGKITILASKPGSNGSNSSSIDIDNANGDPGAIIADKGTVDIRHMGSGGTFGGTINISNANIAADIVKIGALGTTGTLNIGGGMISADTTLKLYASGSNGTVNFNADVTLTGASAKIIAGNIVNILDGVTVHINAVNPVAVYANTANYTGFGGNGTLTGTFDMAGATLAGNLSDAPPFDDASAVAANTTASAVSSRKSRPRSSSRSPAKSSAHDGRASTNRNLATATQGNQPFRP